MRARNTAAASWSQSWSREGSWENEILLSLELLKGVQSHEREEMHLNHYVQRNSGLIYPASPCSVRGLGNGTQGIMRPIHVRFTNAQERYKFISQRSTLFCIIYMNNDLTHHQQEKSRPLWAAFRDAKQRSTAICKKGKLYINNHVYQLKTKPTLPNKINSTEAWNRCQSCQNYNQSVKICVWKINGLNPDDIVDLRSCI